MTFGRTIMGLNPHCWVRFNNDASGLVQDQGSLAGTWEATGTPTYTTGLVRSALPSRAMTFNGSSFYLTGPEGRCAYNTTGAWTLGCVVRFGSVTDGSLFGQYYYEGDEKSYSFWGWKVLLSSGTLTVQSATGGEVFSNITSLGGFITGTDYFVVLQVYDSGGNMKGDIFVNGVLSATATGTGSVANAKPSNISVPRIGTIWTGPSNSFGNYLNGTLSEWMFWQNTQLTTAQIESIQASRYESPDTAAYWRP